METTKNPVNPKKGELKTVRVFVSSTFRDMHAERDYLNSYVFPELRSRCAKKGLEFVGIDLRWGVTEEESRQRKAMEVCLEEIEKCNFFISLLGDRYGWIPPPEEIPKEKFEATRSYEDLRAEDANLLDEWYQLDETSKIPVYRLRGDIVPDTIAEKMVQFWEEAGLEHAGDSITAHEIYLAQSRKSNKNTFFYLRKSGVHENPQFPQDMIPIFIEQDSNKLKKLALLKKNILDKKHEKIIVQEYTANYEGLRVDPSYRPPNLNDKEKEVFNDSVIQPREWSSVGDKVREIIRSKGTVALSGMEELGTQILNDLWDAIEKELEQSAEPLDAHGQERAFHNNFITERTRLFLGRKELLADMLGYIPKINSIFFQVRFVRLLLENILNYVSKIEDRMPLVITGLPGCGKSALMAEYARQCRKKFPGVLVIPHFIGASPGSTDLLFTIRSLCETLRRECNLEDELSADPDKLRGQLHTFLKNAGSKRSIIIILDALNQLDPAYRSHELTWIPITLPPNVRLIVSTLPGDCLEWMQKRVPTKYILQVPALSEKDRRSLIKEHLARRGKKLSGKQINCLLDMKKRQEAGLPLYLLVALEELCLFGNYEELNSQIDNLPATLNELFYKVIQRLESEHNADRTEFILRLIAVSRYGLMESEILDKLGGEYLFNWDSISRNDINRLITFLKNDPIIKLPENIEIIKNNDNETIHVSSEKISINIKLDKKNKNAILDFSTGETYTLQAKEENDKINIHKMEFPRVYWTRFYRSLEFYLRPVDETTGAGLINFYHDQLRFAVFRRYLDMNSPDAAKTEKYFHSHNQLADYFHIIASDKKEPAKWSIENPRSLIELPYHLHESGQDEELRKMLFDFGWMHAKLEATDVNSLKIDYDFLIPEKTLRLVHETISLSAHILAQDKMQLRNQLYGRLRSFQEPEIRTLLERANEWKDGLQLHLLTASLTPPGGHLIRTLWGHTAAVNAVSVTPDGRRVISASNDYTLKVWDIEAGVEINTLKGHTAVVNAVSVTPDGRRTISASWDNTLKVWDIETGAEIRTLKEHISGITEVIRKFKGHTNVVRAVSLTPDGRLAISTSDKTLTVWDMETGVEIRKFKGEHTDYVNTVSVTPDGKHAISTSSDKTLKVWDIETGIEIRTFKGHTFSKLSVTPDGRRAISASHSDNTLTVWDIETGIEITTLKGHTNWVSAVSVTPDGRRVISASWDKTLKVWDIETGIEIRTLKGHTAVVNAVCLTHDGRRVISVSGDKTLKVWDMETGVEIRTLKGYFGLIAVCVTLNGRRAISASYSTITVWDLETGVEIRTLEGYFGLIAVSVTPDGRRIISVSEDKTLKVWDIETGVEIRTLKVHTDMAYAVSLTPDGRYAILASGIGTLTVWDMETGVEIRTLVGHTDVVHAVFVTYDGRRIISATYSTLKVWDMETGVEIRTFKGHTFLAEIVSVTPDSKRIISASDNTLTVWDMETGVEIRTLKGHTNIVRAVSVTPDGKYAVSASYDKTLKIWDMETGVEIRTLEERIDSVSAFTVTPDSRRIISASDNTLKVWDMEAGVKIQTLGGHTDNVNALSFTPDGRHVISASYDNTLKVWDVEAGIEIHTLKGHTSYVSAVSVTPDSRHAISGSWDNTLKVWDIDTGLEIQTLKGHIYSGKAVYMTPDGRHAISGSFDNTLTVWGIETGGEIRTLEGHTGWVIAVCVTPDGKHAISGSWDKTLKVWDMETGVELQTLKGHTGSINAVCVTPDGRRAISASNDNTLKVWDIETGVEFQTLKGHTGSINAVCVTPDGRRAISASNDNTLKVWDLDTGDNIRTLKGHTGWVNTVSVNPDGRYAISGSWDKTLKVWDIETGFEIRSLKGHTDYVMAVSVTPDGRRAISASCDKTLKVWDIGKGIKIHTLNGHTEEVWAVSVTPDGRRAISASDDKTLKVWDIEIGVEIRTLKGHTDPVREVFVTPDGSRAISAASYEELKVWDIDTGLEIQMLGGHNHKVNAVSFTQDGGRAISVSNETLTVWDIKKGVEIKTFKGDNWVAGTVSVTPDGRRVISVSYDKMVTVWDIEKGVKIRTLKGVFTAICITPDGRCAISASGNMLTVWDMETGVKIRTLEGHSGEVTAISVTPDSRRAVSLSNDLMLKIWDIGAGVEIQTLKGYTGGFYVTPDNKFVISTLSNKLTIWDIESGKILTDFCGEGDFITCAISPDGKTIAAGEKSGRVYLLQLECK